MDGYRTDLAYVHDAGFSGFSEGAAPFLLRLLRARGIRRGLLVDLGCGSGGWARHANDAGFDVFGIDRSAALLALARRRAPRARFRLGSFVGAGLPRCEAVTALGEVLGYLFDPRNGARALPRVLARIHGALRPGGVLVLDLAAPGRAAGLGPPRSFTTGRDFAVLVESSEQGRVLTRRITTFRRVGGAYRRAEEVHRLQLHAPSEVLAALRSAGFRARTLAGYGTVRFPPGLVGYVATRPAGE